MKQVPPFNQNQYNKIFFLQDTVSSVNIHANTLLRHHFVEHRKETQLETS